MKNADMPAMPIAIETDVSELGRVTVNDYFNGLTKREMFAMHMSSSVESPTEYYGEKETEISYKKWAKRVVKMADALLAELEK